MQYSSFKDPALILDPWNCYIAYCRFNIISIEIVLNDLMQYIVSRADRSAGRPSAITSYAQK